MRLPQSRFTIRRMMVAVAIVACLLAAAMAYRSYEGNRRIAKFEARANYHAMMDLMTRVERYGPTGAGYNDHIHVRTPRNDFHILMHKKYERAALNPWLPVAPDPPEPP
jgi:Tfp pilus assembly protein PilE